MRIYLKPLLQLTGGLKEVKDILSQVEIIWKYNSVLLKKLEQVNESSICNFYNLQRVENWSPAESAISDIFLSLVDYLKVYSSYITKYNERLEMLSKASKEYPNISTFLDKTQAGLGTQ